MKEWNESEFNRKHELFARVADSFGAISVWSMYDEIDDEDSFDSIPYPDLKVVIYKWYWPSMSLYSDPRPLFVERPRPSLDEPHDPATWYDLWMMADQLIRESGDSHHVFIEAFNPTDEDGVYELVTGS